MNSDGNDFYHCFGRDRIVIFQEFISIYMLADPTIRTFIIVVNLIAIGMVLLAWKRPEWGRGLFGLNFLGAAIFNGVFFFIDPEEFTYYADFAFLGFYRDFIITTFSNHLQAFLGSIIIMQFWTGLALWYKGKWVKLGALCAIIFLIAIAPLGFGAAFPATLIQALGLYFIFRVDFPKSLYKVLFNQ